jgi:transcriptional regulator with XRE-family HTH domain
MVTARPLTTRRGARILMPEIVGRVVWLARRALDVSQQEVAARIGLPPSTVSKLELGNVTMAVHHLDRIAEALTWFERELLGDEARGWEGWELHRTAAQIADRLGDAGYAVVWERPDLAGRPQLYTRGRKLTALMKAHWPEDARRLA